MEPGDDSLVPLDDGLVASFESLLNTAGEDMPAGGIVLGVSVPGHEAFLGATGTADEEAGRAMDTADRFRIGSITKTFVAAVVFQLVDERVLSLDGPVSNYVDGLARGDEITIRHLLNHTSGLKEYSQDSEVQASTDTLWTDEELIALVAAEELVAEPGATWSYANTNYVLLGLIIDSATGVAWDTHVQDRLLEPLGLDQTHAPGAGGSWTDTVPGYVGSVDYTDSVHPSVVGAAGAMESTAGDLLLWGEAYMGGQFLSEEIQTARFADMVEVVEDVLWMGLGVFRFHEDAEVDPEIWHNGALNGYAGWLGHRQSSGVTVAVLVNCWLMRGGNPYIHLPQEVAEEAWLALQPS